jgi:hypothetical protein
MAREAEEARERIVKRLERMRRRYLAGISTDPEKRRAYELLHGPMDWGDISRTG